MSKTVNMSSSLHALWGMSEDYTSIECTLYIKDRAIVILGKVYVVSNERGRIVYGGHFYKTGTLYDCGIDTSLEKMKKIVEKRIFLGETGDEFLNRICFKNKKIT